MELIKLGRVDDVSVSLIPTVEARRDALLVKSEAVKAVDTPEQQDQAMEFARRIKRALNDVEAARKEVKRPVLDLEERIDGLAKDFVKSMREELDRLMLLVSGFQARERIRVQAEEARRQAEVRRLREEEEEARQRMASAEVALAKPRAGLGELAAAEQAEAAVFDAAGRTAVAAAAPPAVVERTSGMVQKKVLTFEVTDAAALYAARPDFFELVQRRSIIRASVTKETVLPGLRVWEEEKVEVRS